VGALTAIVTPLLIATIFLIRYIQSPPLKLARFEAAATPRVKEAPRVNETTLLRGEKPTLSDAEAEEVATLTRLLQTIRVERPEARAAFFRFLELAHKMNCVERLGPSPIRQISEYPEELQKALRPRAPVPLTVLRDFCDRAESYETMADDVLKECEELSFNLGCMG
jgi:hypothetical protein